MTYLQSWNVRLIRPVSKIVVATFVPEDAESLSLLLCYLCVQYCSLKIDQSSNQKIL